jgi:hypothetical protein
MNLRPRFSLRALLLAVGLLSIPCAYVGWEYTVVAHRKWVVQYVLMDRPGKVVYWFKDYSSVGRISWVRRALGDFSLMVVGVGDDAQDELEQIRSTFPEAKIERISRK